MYDSMASQNVPKMLDRLQSTCINPNKNIYFTYKFGFVGNLFVSSETGSNVIVILLILKCASGFTCFDGFRWSCLAKRR